MVRMPSPEQQARFFTNLQLLLTEGKFVSTYKFALLIALTRWAIENPDYDESVPLDAGALAPHFVELYWPQVAPFAGRRDDCGETRLAKRPHDVLWEGVLRQERGGQTPEVFKLILAEHEVGQGVLLDLPVMRRDQLIKKVRNSMKGMPLWRLQNISGREIRFLYRRGKGNRIVFESGILPCLVSFALLVEDAVKSAWLRFVLRYNPEVLGPACQVEDHLFPGERKDLAAWRGVLEELQAARCFYCEHEKRGGVEVDHFLPWSRYPRDLGQNFVLAHRECNSRKKDYLASCEHLERWCQRNDEHRASMDRQFEDLGLPHDWPTLKRVACSHYSIAAACKSRVWHADNTLVPLTDEWRRILGCA